MMEGYQDGFSPEELRVLKKYKGGRIIDPEDEAIVNEFADVGFMRIGVSLSKKMATASTTYPGRLISGEKSLMDRIE